MIGRVSHFRITAARPASAKSSLVWTVWEQEAEKNRKLGVQAELDRRRDAEAMRQEIKGSIK